jgi:glycosyltransferase involved in cell wall biosynthesis
LDSHSHQVRLLKPMRVCMITTTYPRFVDDAAAPFIADIAEGIAALGHRVDVILPYHPQLRDTERNGVSLHPYHVPGDRKQPIWGYAQSMQADVKLKKKALALAPFAAYSAFRCASEVVSRKGCDLVHAHWVLPNGYVAAKVAKKFKLPLVISLHGSDMFLARKSKFFGLLAGRILRKAAMVTACSPDLQEQAAQISGRPVRLLEYGVNIEQFQPSASSAPIPYSIFTAGRLVYKKGFLQLLDAFAKVHNYYPDSTLTIAGSGPLLAKLQEHTRFLGLQESIKFPGNIDRRRLPDSFASSDVVAVPSVTDEMGNRDGLPNVFLEALSAGSAIVATDIPGIQNVAQHNREALIVTAGDVDTLCDAILLLFQNPDVKERLRRAARERAVAELSWDVKCKEFEQIYRQVLDAVNQ